MIFVLQEVMHAQPKILQTELAKIFATYRKRIEIVLLEISSKLVTSFLVFAPEKTERQKQQGYDDRRDDIDRELTLQGINHDCASIIHARRIYDTQRPKAMRRRIALRKHFVRNLHRAYLFREALGVRTRPRVAF